MSWLQLPAECAVTPARVSAVARSAALRLTVPEPVLRVGPDPAGNEWNMLAVGLPVWVRTTSGTRLEQSVTQDGITIVMTAERTNVMVDWGDGTRRTCRSMTERLNGTDPMTESPTCGHVYQSAGMRAISATATWVVTWQALGQHGTITQTRTHTLNPIKIGELRAVNVPVPGR